MWLKDKIVKGEHIKTGCLGYATFNWFDYMADRAFDPWAEPEWVEWIQPKRLPTNCKNCGAPLHGHHCEYCDTEY